MLAVHWTPVANTKRILRNGIAKSKTGLYCFPLTGKPLVDRWWVRFFNHVRQRKKYNGIVFRIRQEDLPAYFGHWIGTTSKDKFDKPILSLKHLKTEFRENLLFRAGAAYMEEKGSLTSVDDFEKDFIKIAKTEIKDRKKLKELISEVGLVLFTFEDYQIVLTNSIPASRIIKVISDGSETGRQRRKKKLTKSKSLI